MDAIPVPLHKFSQVHVDLVGPWPRSAEGHTHLLTVVDRTTRWAEAIPLQSTTAQVVADSFVANWVVKQPKRIVSHLLTAILIMFKEYKKEIVQHSV